MTYERYSAVPVIVGPKYCTSTTRPPEPLVGEYIHETDTGRDFVFSGEGWLPLLRDTDPAVTEWRTALGQSTSAQLRETQADLTAMQARYEESRAEVRRLEAELGSALGALNEQRGGR